MDRGMIQLKDDHNLWSKPEADKGRVVRLTLRFHGRSLEETCRGVGIENGLKRKTIAVTNFYVVS